MLKLCAAQLKQVYPCRFKDNFKVGKIGESVNVNIKLEILLSRILNFCHLLQCHLHCFLLKIRDLLG